MAYVSGLTEAELDDWTVLQFEHRLKAIERDKTFTLYRQAELSGMVKFPNGNPCPSWCYDAKTLTAGLIPLSDIAQKHKGLGDVMGVVDAAAQQSAKAQTNK